jgi:hypothetical protein
MTWFVVGIASWIALPLICWVWLDCSIDVEERERNEVRSSRDRRSVLREAFRRAKTDTSITEDK